jgi:hypothetical protein
MRYGGADTQNKSHYSVVIEKKKEMYMKRWGFVLFSVSILMTTSCVVSQPALGTVEKAPVEIEWICVNSNQSHYVGIHRAKVPGGWLIRYDRADGVAGCFYPDPRHEWGKSDGKKSAE